MAIAGRKDTIGLLGLAAGAALATPWVGSAYAPLAAGVMAAAGTGFITAGWFKKGLDRTNVKSSTDFIIPSDTPPSSCIGREGVRIGLTLDNHRPVDLANDLLKRHTAIIGQSGVGKTTLIEYLLWQQTMRGGGWLFIDGKVDHDTRNHVAYMAELAGRQDELYVLDISDPDNSNTANPILEGDPDEVASRLLNLIPSTESNAGADHYRQTANQALTAILGALKAAKKLYHFGDLSILLQSGRAVEELIKVTPECPAKRSLLIFLDKYKKRNKDGQINIEVDRMKTDLGGIAGRIAHFAQGKFGRVFNVYAPEIVLKEIILQGKMLYVSLPTMGKDTAALNLGKMIISDLRSAVATLQELPKSERPEIPFMAVLDELGSYVIKTVSTLFEQARSAGISLVPSFQSFSQLNEVSSDFADIIIQNTWNKVCFKFGAVESSNTACELLGQSIKHVKTISSSNNQGKGAALLRTTPEANKTDSGGTGVSWKEDMDYRVTPDQIRSLDMGQIFLLSGSKFFHMRTPMLTYPKLANYEAMRYRTFPAKGQQPLNFEDRLDEFLMTG